MEFVNSPSVAAVAIAVKEGIVLIRRNQKSEDMYGKLALPGGYQNGNKKELIHHAARREIFEELGLLIFPERMKLLQASCTDQHGTNLWFFLYTGYSHMEFERLATIYVTPDAKEVSEVTFTNTAMVDTYPLHQKAISEALKEMKSGQEIR